MSVIQGHRSLVRRYRGQHYFPDTERRHLFVEPLYLRNMNYSYVNSKDIAHIFLCRRGETSWHLRDTEAYLSLCNGYTIFPCLDKKIGGDVFLYNNAGCLSLMKRYSNTSVSRTLGRVNSVQIIYRVSLFTQETLRELIPPERYTGYPSK